MGSGEHCVSRYTKKLLVSGRAIHGALVGANDATPERGLGEDIGHHGGLGVWNFGCSHLVGPSREQKGIERWMLGVVAIYDLSLL